MKKVFVVVNPTSGQSDHKRVAEFIAQKCDNHGWQCDFYETTGDHTDEENLERAGGQNYDLYIAAGGDGTVALVANAVIDTGTPLAIIPTGTGNGAARVLNIPLDWQAALSFLFENNKINTLDTMYAGGRHFLLHMGVGLSGIALRDIDLQSKRLLGRLSYPFAGLRAFFGYQPHAFEITIDGEKHHFKGTEMFVINSASMGDPFVRWSDRIKPTDGMLDVFFVRARTFIDFVRLAWNIVLGRQRMDPNVTYHRSGESIHVRSDPALPLQADGEYVTQTPVTVEVVPDAIQIIGPDDNFKLKNARNPHG